MRVLLIEDDAMLADAVGAALAETGYTVTVAPDAATALRRTADERFDLAVLDLGLPDRDGLDLLGDMKRAAPALPVLILTARDALDDRIRGLDAGADDYLVKPFALGELEARLRALLRRAGEPSPRFQLARLRFDAVSRHATIGDKVLEITSREFALLEALSARPHAVVGKDALFDAVFPEASDVAPNALEVHVSRLRRKLRPAGVTVRSLRGLGYRLETLDDAQP